MILSPDDLKELTAMLRLNEQPVWHGSQEVEYCFQQIGRIITNSESLPTATSRLAILINELFIILLEMLRKRDIPQQQNLLSAESTTEKFLKELEQSLEKPWSIDAMAECAGLKRTRFAHYCKKLKNMTPVHYLNHLRIVKAKQMLLENPKKKPHRSRT